MRTIIVPSTDDVNIVNQAFNRLTPNRTLIERLILQGQFNLKGTILVPDVTRLELQCILKRQANVSEVQNYPLIRNKSTSGNRRIELIGYPNTLVDGNKAQQTKNNDVVRLQNVRDSLIQGLVVTGARWVEVEFLYGNNISLWGCNNVTVKDNLLTQAGYDNVRVRGACKNCKVIDNVIIGADKSGGCQISTAGTSGNLVEGNTIIMPPGKDGNIKMHDSDHNIARRNLLVGDPYAKLVDLIANANNNTIEQNYMLNGAPCLGTRLADSLSPYDNKALNNILRTYSTSTAVRLVANRRFLVKGNAIIKAAIGVDIQSGAIDTRIEANNFKACTKNINDLGVGTVITPDNTYSTVMPQEHALQVTADAEGRTNPPVRTYNLIHGTVLTLRAYPNLGYRAVGWQINGTLFRSSILNVKIDANTQAHAVFEKAPTQIPFLPLLVVAGGIILLSSKV